jgi:hypothetical protein
MKSFNIQKEAIVLTRYLISKHPTQKAIDLYKEACRHHIIELTSKEQRLWRKAMRFPVLLPFIDAGFALQKQTSSLRKKILIMFAILESLPDYANHFLPQKRKGSLLIIFLLACTSATRAGIGLILLWIL